MAAWPAMLLLAAVPYLGCNGEIWAVRATPEPVVDGCFEGTYVDAVRRIRVIVYQEVNWVTINGTASEQPWEFFTFTGNVHEVGTSSGDFFVWIAENGNGIARCFAQWESVYLLPASDAACTERSSLEFSFRYDCNGHSARIDFNGNRS
jgi:hypothetical protein